MAPILVHQKQYVLGPRPVTVRPDWIVFHMADGLVLSHCPNLRVTLLRSRDGVEHCLLGLAVPADVPNSSISDTFHSRESSEIEEWTGCWAGRWLLVSPTLCCQDASGCLGVYYRRAGGEFWMSSSPALLGDHLPDVPAAARLPWRIVHNKGTDWIPAPLTTREGVFKVLPQRSLDPRDGSMRPVHYVPLNSNARADVELLASTLKTIMTNWAHVHFREHYLGLTAGLDTRTVLAAAVGAKISAQTFTTNYPVVQKRDVILAPRVAARAGAPHTLRTPLPLAPAERDARIAAMSEHTDGATFHNELACYSRCEDDLLNDRERTFAKGNCFEVGRCFYWTKFSNVGQIEPPTDADQVLAAFAFRSTWRPNPAQLWRQAVQSWIASLSDPLPLELDWRDRFYLDQRLGSWNATVQQGYDVFGSTFFYPGNCLRIFDLLLRHDPAKRKEGFAQREAIRLLAPRLLEVPINPLPISTRLKQMVRELLGPRAIHALKSLAPRSMLRHAP
jgi:hypothetical protein